MGKRIVVIGQGAREHALAYRLEKNADGMKDKNRHIFVVPGNPGIMRDFECVTPKYPGVVGITDELKRIQPDLVVIGPEYWLAEGLSDVLIEAKIPVFGPSKKAAEIEASKIFMKDICRSAKVKTACSEAFSDKNTAIQWVIAQPEKPFVIKVDGLCAGKGVVIAQNKSEALSHIEFLFSKEGFRKLGIENHNFLIEEFLAGREVSVFAMCNGSDAALFAPLQDHKRLSDNDMGPNTGGMGAVACLGENNEERRAFLAKVKEEIILPTLKEMSLRGCPFKGLLYAGLMLVNNDIYVLEFNARFGDPETQALMMGLKTDIFPLFEQIATDALIDVAWWQESLLAIDVAVSVVFASKNYPFSSSASAEITLPKTLPPTTRLFFAGVSTNEDKLMAESGRILSVASVAPTLHQAQKDAYDVAQQVLFAGAHYRSDIGSSLSHLV